MIKSQVQPWPTYFQMIHIFISLNLFIPWVIGSVHQVLLDVSECFQILFLVALFFIIPARLFPVCVFHRFLFLSFNKKAFILLGFWMRITLVVLAFSLVFIFLGLLFLIFVLFRCFDSFEFLNFFVSYQFDHVMILLMH